MQDFADMLFQIALKRGRYTDPLSLMPYQTQVYSQNGEDGIIAEIFARIGRRDGFFVEIGVEDGTQCNTRFLLESGWRGVWIEADAGNATKAQSKFGDYVRQERLLIVNSQASVVNLNTMMSRAGVPTRFDFLSIDVDQNTSHLWQALSYGSRVACIEYNANLPLSQPVQVPYDPEAQWGKTNWYGASLKKLEQIGRAKQLSLVGCELAGVNAFFVTDDECGGEFRAPFTAEEHYEPPRYPLVKSWGHPASSEAKKWVE